jgi:hypothetical protein
MGLQPVADGAGNPQVEVGGHCDANNIAQTFFKKTQKNIGH